MSNIPSELVPNAVSLDKHQQLHAKIEQLQSMLLAAHPSMPQLLREIHGNLQKDEELLYMLKEEDINVIVNGLEKQSQVQIIQAAVSGKGAGSKKNLGKLNLDDGSL